MFGELEATKARPMSHTMKEILSKEGIPGFYRGLTAALFRQSIFSTVRFGAFDSLSKAFPNAKGAAAIPIGMCTFKECQSVPECVIVWGKVVVDLHIGNVRLRHGRRCNRSTPQLSY